MILTSRETESNFASTWNVEVERGGYLQLPHDFYRNASNLGLSTTDTMVAIYIMGYEMGSFIAASSVAEAFGISIGTVRKSFRKLDALNLVHRHFQKGDANRFSYKGLRQQVGEYAKLRESTVKNSPIGVSRKPSNHGRNQYTNKEPKRTNNGADGLEKLRRMRKEKGI